METVTAKLEESGRILIPAAVRRKLNLKPGSEVLLRVDDTGIQVGTRQQAITRIQKRLREYIPKDRMLSDELIQERREEAGRENAR